MSDNETGSIVLGGKTGARHWDKEIYDQGEKCGHCNTYQHRVVFHDGDILDVGCLCGYRSYSDLDGYYDRDWVTDNVYRLFLLDKEGQAEIHFFRDGTDGKPVRQQMSEFCKKWKAECPMMLPLDAVPGANPTLVATALHMAEAFYNDFETAVILHHHYAGDDGSEAMNKLYEQDMRDQDEDPYGHQSPEELQSIAESRGFANYAEFLEHFWTLPKSSDLQSTQTT